MFVKLFRSSKYEVNMEQEEESSFNIDFGNTPMQLKKRISSGFIDHNNEDFFPPEVGKEMIIKDQEKTKELMNQNVSSCSSWTLQSQICTSVAEYFKKRSEPLVSISDQGSSRKIYFGQDASTPMSCRKSFTINTVFSGTDDAFEMLPARKNSDLLPMQFYRTTLKSMDTSPIKSLDFSDNIGTENIKFLCSNNLEDSSFQSSSGLSSTCNLQKLKENETEQWTVQPRELTLDASGRGRLLLINNSTQNLTFKAIFDGKLIDVCPLRGILHSRSQIGIRIRLSRLREKLNVCEDIEDIVKITCGNTEKSIHITICKVKKEKSTVNRSFICF